jgi:iron complex transport system ATP-binding protein
MLSAEKISAGYGSQPVLREISIEIRPGDVLALLGPNGSGKSTLLSALCGVVRVSEGEVRLGDRLICEMDRRSVSRQVAYVPQQFAFTQGFRVEEIVLMGRSCWLGAFERPGETDRRKVKEALAAMELEEVRRKPVTELSGGEAQRACLARALAQDTRLCLFDEPTASLDPRHALLVMKRLADLAKEGKGVAVALHDVNLAFRYASRMAFLKEGRLFGVYAPDEVSEAVLESVFEVGWRFAAAPGQARLAFPV